MTEPILELVALYFEQQLTAWVTQPEVLHPNNSAVQSGVFGTEDQRHRAVIADGMEAADSLGRLIEKIRSGDTRQALSFLRRQAVNSDEARELMLALDSTATPAYPSADKNGKPVVVGAVYRWQPRADNCGNEPGYYCEGTVSKVLDRRVFAYWLRVGQANPAYWANSDDDETNVEPIPEPQITWVFTKMLTPAA
jgi:hypothetical protein